MVKVRRFRAFICDNVSCTYAHLYKHTHIHIYTYMWRLTPATDAMCKVRFQRQKWSLTCGVRVCVTVYLDFPGVPPILGLSWVILGAIWGCLGVSWVISGPFGGPVWSPQLASKSTKHVFFSGPFLDHFCGSFWSLKTKIFILCCLVQHFCAVSEHPRRPGYNQVVDSVGNFGDQNWPKTQQQLC